MMTETLRYPRYKWVIVPAIIAAVLLFLLTQSDRLMSNIYLRYLDYKWNNIEITGFSPVTNELQDGFPDDWIPRSWNNGRAIVQIESEQVHTG